MKLLIEQEGPPGIAPEFEGQRYLDTLEGDLWIGVTKENNLVFRPLRSEAITSSSPLTILAYRRGIFSARYSFFTSVHGYDLSPCGAFTNRDITKVITSTQSIVLESVELQDTIPEFTSTRNPIQNTVTLKQEV